jgi:putative phage-type endonuclease
VALTRDQVKARGPRIGGDDAAAICGKHPYKTAYEIALRIRGEIEPEDLEGKDIIEFGNEMEGVLARFYERKNKVKLIEPDTIVHPKYPFIAGNLDRRIEGDPTTGIECKNTGVFVKDSWGQPGTDEVPERVILQTSHYMMCAPEIERFKILRCFGGNQYQEYVVPRNQGLIDALLQIELAFYENIQAGRIPEPDWFHRTTSDALSRAFKKVEGTIEARPDLVHWTLSYEEASAEAKRTAELKEAIKNHIDFLMGNIEIALLPDGRKWVRKEIKKSEYTVAASSYIQNKLTKPRATKS